MNITAQHTNRSAKARSGHPMLPLLLDVAIPLGAYYLMQHLGFSLMTSLVVSGLVPCVRVVWGAIRDRRIEGLALAVLTLTVVSIPVALIAGSPKLMLAKEAVGTGALGIWMIVSARISRPAMADGVRPFMAKSVGSSAAWDELVVDSARFRACLNAITMVWGVGFLVECVARVTLVCLLPVHAAVWMNNFPVIAVIAGCILIQGVWARQLYRMLMERVAENDQRTEAEAQAQAEAEVQALPTVLAA
jgi:hypothetical protein